MEESTEQDTVETDAAEEGKEHDLEFDPDQVEHDPSHEPPVAELKDLKGG